MHSYSIVDVSKHLCHLSVIIAVICHHFVFIAVVCHHSVSSSPSSVTTLASP